MPQKSDVFIVDSDKAFSELLATYLRNNDFKVHVFHEPFLALKHLEDSSCRIVLLELDFMQIDGFVLCEKIHKNFDVSIIVISSKDSESDIVLALEKGADDYMVKPLRIRELVARIGVQLRKINSVMALDDVFEDDEFKCNKSTMQIFFRGKPLKLTNAEFGVLRLMLMHKRKVFSREQILDNVDSMSWNSSDRSIDVIINRLRKKLGDSSKNPRYIESVRGMGYRML